MRRRIFIRNYSWTITFRGLIVFAVGLGAGIVLFQFTDNSDKPIPITDQSAVTAFKSVDQSVTKTVISTGSLVNTKPISRYDFGVNQVWYENGYGSTNPLTQKPYKQLVSDTKAIGVSIVRYPGGNPSDLFHWQQAIGPQNLRQPNITNGGTIVDPSGLVPSTYGPDEFGRFLSSTDAAGDITVNFGTGTAEEAEDWVCYMTSTTTNATDPDCDAWAALRTKNGHPTPYNIPYWEVGNEPNLGAYWRKGTVVSSPGNCQTGDTACLYVYGGTTSFSNQSVQRLAAQNSANQIVGYDYFVADPPIVPGTAALSVQLPLATHRRVGSPPSSIAHLSSSVWQQVPAAELAKSPLGSHDYALNETTGQLTFHVLSGSSELPATATATISYQSGDHDGFISFYNAMKAADPAAHICATYPTTAALQDLGTTATYDCYVVHDYGLPRGSDNHGQYTASQFHDQMLLSTAHLNQGILSSKAAIENYAGSNANAVQLVMTEYGILNYDVPANSDVESSSELFPGVSDYHRSMDLGLFAADMLRNILNDGISMAEKHYLVGYNLAPPPGLQGAFNSHLFSGNALIDTAYPDCTGTGSSESCAQPPYILQPTAYVLQAYAKLLGNRLVSSSISANPAITVPPHVAGSKTALSGSFPLLASVATTDGHGSESMLIINNSENRYLTAQVKPSLSNFTHVYAETLAGNGTDSYLNFNTLASPHAISFRSSESDLDEGQVDADFPPSSITVLRFSACSAAHNAPCVIASPGAGQQEPDNPIKK